MSAEQSTGPVAAKPTVRRSGGSFDVVVVVDWSAAAVPTAGRDSIWLAIRHGASVELHNPATRHAARELLHHLLGQHRSQRILIGVDVGLGSPAGAARAALGDDPTAGPSWRRWWRHLATHLVDDSTNANNRFAVAAALNERISSGPGPFWGTTSAATAGHHLRRTKAPGFPHPAADGTILDEFRLVEHLLRRARMRPASIWQLAGAGAVGSQSLTCIPVLEALRHHADGPRRLHVWPFETGFAADPAASTSDAVIVAEVWPTLVPLPDPAPHPVRDATQVLVLSEVLAGADRDGRLAHWFDPGIPEPAQLRLLDEEGWVLGVEWSEPDDDRLRSPG